MRKCKTSKIIKCTCKGRTYKELWENIKSELSMKENDPFCEKDHYFEDVPNFQEYLTDEQRITKSKISFTNYIEVDPSSFNENNIFEFFHGILFYIYYYSNNKFNISEVEFHFSGAKYRKSLSYLINQKQNSIDYYDILNLYDYENMNSQFAINCVRNAFFGVTFKRIKITPTSYSIRSGTFSKQFGNLISFTFEAFDEEKQKWIVLDERENINNLNSGSGFAMFFVRTTNKSYSSFKIKQTEPGSNGYWGFSISAFDIHGVVSISENTEILSNSLFDINQQSLVNNNVYENVIDPIMNMSDFIF